MSIINLCKNYVCHLNKKISISLVFLSLLGHFDTHSSKSQNFIANKWCVTNYIKNKELIILLGFFLLKPTLRVFVNFFFKKILIALYGKYKKNYQKNQSFFSFPIKNF